MKTRFTLLISCILITLICSNCKKEISKIFSESSESFTSKNEITLINPNIIQIDTSINQFEGIDLCGIKYADSTMRFLRNLDNSIPLTQGGKDSLDRFTKGRIFGCKLNNKMGESKQPWTPVPIEIQRYFPNPREVFEYLALVEVENGTNNGLNLFINGYKQSLNSTPNQLEIYERSSKILTHVSNEFFTPYNSNILAPSNSYRSELSLAALNILTGSFPIPANIYNEFIKSPNEPSITYPTVTEIGWIKIYKNHETDPDPINFVPEISDLGLNKYYYGDEISRMDNFANTHEAPIYNTLIFYQNGLYYSDFSKTKILPDGFYSANLTKIYQIVNGIIIQRYNLTKCPTCPFTELPPLLNPFGGLNLNQ